MNEKEAKAKIDDIVQNKYEKLQRFRSFLEAEGSLFANLRIQEGRSFCYRFTLSVNIANMDRTSIEEFRDLLGCGTIRQQQRQRVIWYWELVSNEDIHNMFIPLMQRLPWQTLKLQHDFELFAQLDALLNSSLKKDVSFLLKVLSLRNQFMSRKIRGTGVNDKTNFEKLLNLLVKQYERGPNNPELLSNIQVLKGAIQTLNDTNSTVWR